MIFTNKLSKILIVIIIILTIILGIVTYLFIFAKNSNEKAVNQLYNVMMAIENAGGELESQEDGTIILIKRDNPVKRDPVEE